MTVPGVPPGGGGGSKPPGSQEPNPFPPIPGGAGDPWVAYAQQMFPGRPDAILYVKQLKDNMIKMIGNTMNSINKRHKIANEYNQKVAKGEE